MVLQRHVDGIVVGRVDLPLYWAPSPNFCEPDIVLSAAAINNVKVNSDGLLHVGSTAGNYDFLGEGNTVVEIKNELTARHQP